VTTDKHPHQIGEVKPQGAQSDTSPDTGQGSSVPQPLSRGFKTSTSACARAIAQDTSIDITFDDQASDVNRTA